MVFIQKAPGNAVQPCSPNKIALSRTTTLKPHKRILPVGFQTLAKTSLKPITERVNRALIALAGSEAMKQPVLIDVQQAIELLSMTEPAFEFDEGYGFDWDTARSSLTYLAGLNGTGQRTLALPECRAGAIDDHCFTGHNLIVCVSPFW